VEERTHPRHLLGRIVLVITVLVLGMQAASADVWCTQSNGQAKCLCSGKWDNDKQGYDYSRLDESQAKPWLSLVQRSASPDVLLQKRQHHPIPTMCCLRLFPQHIVI
jgi:hypothetical protein